jgi:hypothetical protein
MANQSGKPTPLASISKEADIVRHMSTQLESLARVLSYVPTTDPDQKPTVSPDDFVSIMGLFQEHLATLKDIAEGIDRAVEHEMTTGLTLVNG